MVRNGKVRVLYSYPHKIGADRICYTAWQQVNGLAAAGAEVLLFPGVLHRAVDKRVKVRQTLGRGMLRIPYRVLGRMNALALHDHIVGRRMKALAGQIDIVHVWPLAAKQTLKMAAKLGIPTVLERPNAHTRFAYEVVKKECEQLNVSLPKGHEHAFSRDILDKEEVEYQLTDYLLCPSDFVARTFLERRFPQNKLARHQYGFDEKVYYSGGISRDLDRGLSVLFVGGCAPRKGLHYALEAWLKSPAHQNGVFLIAGAFVPGYAEKLARMLDDPSIHVLGHRNDVPELMKKSDILVLPTIEEGSALVTYEGRGSGCVLLVSEAAGAICKHMENALVHRVGDVQTISQHITLLHENRELLERLRASSHSTVHELTWTAAGQKLLSVYKDILKHYKPCFQG